MHRRPQIPATFASIRRALRLALLTTSLLAGANVGVSAQKSGEDLGPCPRDETGAIEGDLSYLGSNDPKMLKDPCYRWLNGLDKPEPKTKPAATPPAPGPVSGDRKSGASSADGRGASATPKSTGPSLLGDPNSPAVTGGPPRSDAVTKAPPLSEWDAEQALQEALAGGTRMTREDIAKIFTPWISNDSKSNAAAQARMAGKKLKELMLERSRRAGNSDADEDITEDNYSVIGEFEHIAFLADLRGPNNELIFPAVSAMMPVAAKMAVVAATSDDPDARRAFQRLRAMLIGMDAAAWAARKQQMLP